MILDDLFGEILTPSGQPGPLHKAYERAVEGIGHAMLGAGLVSLLGVWGLLPGMAVAVAYWWIKERGDLKRGGSWADGAEDMLLVWLGAFYGPWWWPFVILAVGGYLMIMGHVAAISATFKLRETLKLLKKPGLPKLLKML